MQYLIYVLAGIGAGVGTGIAGLSAALIIAPMLLTFVGMPAYEAVTIALASDVLASAISAVMYARMKNIDIYACRQLYRSVRRKCNSKVFFYFYGTDDRSQVYNYAGYDYKRGDAAEAAPGKSYKIALRRCGNRFHMRLCRSRRRCDDVDSADLAAGV